MQRGTTGKQEKSEGAYQLANTPELSRIFQEGPVWAGPASWKNL